MEFLPCRVWWEGAGVRAVSMVFGGSLAEKGDLGADGNPYVCADWAAFH